MPMQMNLQSILQNKLLILSETQGNLTQNF